MNVPFQQDGRLAVGHRFSVMLGGGRNIFQFGDMQLFSLRSHSEVGDQGVVRQEECESHFLTFGCRVIEFAVEHGLAVVGLN